VASPPSKDSDSGLGVGIIVAIAVAAAVALVCAILAGIVMRRRSAKETYDGQHVHIEPVRCLAFN
jgi:hypothetical protein